MPVVLIVETFDKDEDISYTKQLETKNFCSTECACDFLFDEFEVEGINLSDNQVINVIDCSITVAMSDDDVVCEYGC
jgi:hypothetical protein